MKPEIPYEAINSGILQSLTWQRGLIALGTAIGFFGLAKLAAVLLRRFLSKHPHVGGSRFALAKLLSYFIVVVGFITALGILGLPLTSVVWISSALLVGVGFSLQDPARDVVSGVILLIEQRIRKGDFVTFANISGTVQDIGLRSSCVLTRDGITLVVPNHLLVATELSNQSYPRERARVHVAVPIASHADVDAVEQTLYDVAADHEEVLDEPAPIVRFRGVLDTHFELSLIVWVKDPIATRRIASELRFAIARAFRHRRLPFHTPELHLVGQADAEWKAAVTDDEESDVREPT